MRLNLLQFAAAALFVVCAGTPVLAQSTTGVVTGTVSPLLAKATDLGALPVSQPVTGVVLQLQTTAAQQADLTQFLAGLTDTASAQHHQWLTPSQFADRFGASAADVAALTTWLEARGLRVDFIAQARSFVVVSGSAAQVERAFGVQLDRFQLAHGGTGFANTADPVLSAEIAALIANIRGLNDFAYAATAGSVAAGAGAAALDVAPLTARGLNGAGVGLLLANADEASAAAAVAPQAGMSDGSQKNADPLLAAAFGIDGNASPVMRVGGGCAAKLAVSDMVWFESVAEQANAQGITLVAATHDCAHGPAFPAILSEVTAVGRVSAAEAAPVEYPVARPSWQNAVGLPSDGLRYTPDVAVNQTADAGDAAAFAAALTLVVQKAAVRQGNVNSILYSLANEPGVFPGNASMGLTVLGAETGTGSAAQWSTLGGLGVPDATPLLDLWPLGSTASNTQLSSSNYAPTHGQSITLTATVTSGATGQVIFYTGGTTFLGQSALNAGTATLTISSLDGGTYAITAAYQGDGTYAGSTSGQATVTVLPEAASIAASVTGTPVIGVSFPVQVSVAGTSGLGAPTGTIRVTPQGVSNSTPGTGTLSQGAGGANTSTATINVMIGQAGTFTLQTSCTPGDQNFTCSTPNSMQVTVAAGTTSTVLTYAPNPPTAGAPITETATVTPSVSGANIIAPTGTVTFFDGATSIGSGALTAGTATFTTTLTPGKTHSLTAKYGGDTNFGNSTSPAVSAAGGTIASVTGLSSSTFTSTYGANITFTSVVTPDPSVTTALSPTGKVNFYANGTLLGSATLASGVASYSTTTLPVGTQSITATYVGDGNFAASTSTVSNVVTVSAATGTLAATVSPASVAYGATATVTATLTLSNGGTPTGTISATIPGTGGGTYTGALVANTGGSATATIVVNAPPPGTYTITVACATIGGATPNFTCTPTTAPLTTTKGATAVAVSFLPVAPLAGQTTQVTALITNTGNGTGAYTFTGSVTFYDNGAAIGTAAVSANQASTNVTFKANAVHNITAIYSGDTNWTGSTSSATPITAMASPTTTSLSSNYTTALSGTNLILTATVGGSDGTLLLIPTGQVTFYDNYNGVIAKLGTAVLSADGPYMSMATLTTTGLQGGDHNIFSIYAGDSNFATSTSTTLTITEQDYSLIFNPSTLTLNRGQSGQVAVLLGTVGGFNGTISFGCTPPPNTQTTCSFLPSTVTSGGSTTLFIGTTAPSARTGTTTAGNLAPVLIPFTAMGMLLLPGRRKRLGVRLGSGLLLLLLAAGLANLGCTTVEVNPNGTTGGGPGGGGTATGTPLGSNTFTITTAGTSTGSNGTYTVRHTTTFMVTAQ